MFLADAHSQGSTSTFHRTHRVRLLTFTVARSYYQSLAAVESRTLLNFSRSLGWGNREQWAGSEQVQSSVTSVSDH